MYSHHAVSSQLDSDIKRVVTPGFEAKFRRLTNKLGTVRIEFWKHNLAVGLNHGYGEDADYLQYILDLIQDELDDKA